MITEHNEEVIRQLVSGILKQIEPATDEKLREGLRDTPARVARAYKELFAGYSVSVRDLFTEFAEQYNGMVVVRNIDFTSMCEHHMMPFHGVAHVGYVPNGKVVGLSKLARLVEAYARRLQVQERMTREIADAVNEHLKPVGCGCIIEAKHGCMSCRGVLKPDAETVTDSLRGSFKEDARARSEFLMTCFRGK